MSERLAAPVDSPANARFARSSRPETFPRCVASGTYVGFDSASMTDCEIRQVWMLPLCVQNCRYDLPLTTTGVQICRSAARERAISEHRLNQVEPPKIVVTAIRVSEDSTRVAISALGQCADPRT